MKPAMKVLLEKSVIKNLFILLLAIIVANFLNAQTLPAIGNQTKIYIVRHAEKQPGEDPFLTAEGNIRAGDLMRTLKNKRIKRIYVSQFKRTQQTADSMFLQAGIDTVQYVADVSCTDLFNAIEKNKDWNNHILIISHSNIIQKIILKLGVTDFPQQNMPANEFDNLYLVRFKNKQPFVEQSKYGKPSTASETITQ